MKPLVVTIAFVYAAATVQVQAFSVEDLARRAIERRAVEAVNWGMSAVNFELMYQSMVKTGGKYNHDLARERARENATFLQMVEAVWRSQSAM